MHQIHVAAAALALAIVPAPAAAQIGPDSPSHQSDANLHCSVPDSVIGGSLLPNGDYEVSEHYQGRYFTDIYRLVDWWRTMPIMQRVARIHDVPCRHNLPEEE